MSGLDVEDMCPSNSLASACENASLSTLSVCVCVCVSISAVLHEGFLVRCVLTGFPGTYSWVCPPASGWGPPASGWGLTAPGSPPSRCRGQSRLLPERHDVLDQTRGRGGRG